MEVVQPKRKKGIKSKQYQGEIIKKARVEGKSYISYSGKEVMPRALGENCNCIFKCFDKTTAEQREETFIKFYSFQNKNEQDAYLQSLIHSLPIIRERPNVAGEPCKARKCNFSYHITTSSGCIKVCKKAFMGIHAISKNRITRLCSLLLQGKSPRDMRGKGVTHNAKPQFTLNLVREHISSFPTKETHYASKVCQYLSEKLNVKMMYNMFRAKYPEVNISYVYYLRHFHMDFSLRFGRPQVDTCGDCETFSAKIKNKNLNENARLAAIAEKMVHLRRAKKFFKKLEEITELTKSRDDVAGFCIDYMQNLQLPEIPVQEIFYYRQLVVNVFGIHDLKSGRAKFFVYHEGISTKSSDEVCSFMLDYIESEIPNSVKQLYVFSDGCTGQNKNHTVLRFFSMLTSLGRFEKIQNFFPIRGHSYNPCDRDFAVIKRKIRKTDRVYTVREYVELILSSSASNKFQVVLVSPEMVFDFKTWWPRYYKKNVISNETKGRAFKKGEKITLQTSKFMEFTYYAKQKGVIRAHKFIDGLQESSFDVNLPTTSDRLPLCWPSTQSVPSGQRAINIEKMNDLHKIKKYLPETKRIQSFWRKIFSWPTRSGEEQAEEHE